MIDPQLREQGAAPLTSRVLRQFAGLWTVFALGLGYWKGIIAGNTTFAWICAGLAVMPGLAGLAFPALVRPVFTILTAVTLPIGWVMSHVILAIMFYAVFTPVAVVFRLIGRDALARRPDPDQATYWTAKPAAADARSYFRQF